MSDLEITIENIVRQVMDRLAKDRTPNAQTTQILATQQPTKAPIDSEQVASKVITVGELDKLKRTTRQIVVAKGTVITPSARDWLNEKNVNVTWSVNGINKPVNATSKTEQLLLFGNVIGHANIAGLLNKLRSKNISVQQIANTGLTAVIGEMTDGISRGEMRGVLFADKLWQATVLANKPSGVFAVHARDLRELEQIKKQTAVNLLIVNPRGLSEFAMQNMIQLLFKL
jgi:hypothetical protein